MSDSPYKALCISLIRWQIVVRFRPDWKVFTRKTELPVFGFGIEEQV